MHIKDFGEKPTHEFLNETYPTTAGKKQRAIFVKTNTTNSAQVENVVKECVAEYGRLDMYATSFFFPHEPAR